jgi:hypothetical protein
MQKASSNYVYSILNSAFCIQHFVRVEGLEPAYREAPDPKSGVSTNFTTPAILFIRAT